MTWLRLDDRFAEHPKVAALSDRAFRAHLSAMCWSARNRTKGWLADGVIKMLGTTTKTARELATADLWEPGRGGYQIHDWGRFNPLKEHGPLTPEERAAKAEAGRLGGLASGEARRSIKESTNEADDEAESACGSASENEAERSTSRAAAPVLPVTRNPVTRNPSGSNEPLGGGAKRTRSTPFLTEDERCAILTEPKYQCLGDEIGDAIDLALSHKSARNITTGTWNLYVRNWLNNDLNRLPASVREKPYEEPYRPDFGEGRPKRVDVDALVFGDSR